MTIRQRATQPNKNPVINSGLFLKTNENSNIFLQVSEYHYVCNRASGSITSKIQVNQAVFSTLL